MLRSLPEILFSANHFSKKRTIRARRSTLFNAFQSSDNRDFALSDTNLLGSSASCLKIETGVLLLKAIRALTVSLESFASS